LFQLLHFRDKQIWSGKTITVTVQLKRIDKLFTFLRYKCFTVASARFGFYICEQQ